MTLLIHVHVHGALSIYMMHAVPSILFATLPNLSPPLHTPPSPPPTPARPLPECALPLPRVHLCTHPYFPNHNTTPFPHLPGLPRDGVQVHAGVLDCRPQEAAQLHPGGEDTGDPSGGKPLRWVSSVMINELPVGHIWACSNLVWVEWVYQSHTHLEHTRCNEWVLVEWPVRCDW